MSEILQLQIVLSSEMFAVTCPDVNLRAFI